MVDQGIRQNASRRFGGARYRARRGDGVKAPKNAREFADVLSQMFLAASSEDRDHDKDSPAAWTSYRTNGLQRVGTALLMSAGFDQGGEPLGRRDADGEGSGWLGVGPDFRAVAEEHLTGKQLDALRLAADGHGSREIGRRLGVDESTVRERLRSSGKKLTRKNTPANCTIGRGKNNAAPHDEVGQSEPTEHLILCGPRSPESDPMRVRHIPFFPALDRPDLYMSETGAVGYWTTLPQNPRSIAWEPATVRGPDEDDPHITEMPPVEDYYPDPGLAAVDEIKVLRTMVGDRPVVTFQSSTERTNEFAARHQRRVNDWLGVKGRSLPRKADGVAPRRRLLPNVM